MVQIINTIYKIYLYTIHNITILIIVLKEEFILKNQQNTNLQLFT